MIDLEFVGTILNFFLCRRWLLLGHQVRTTNNIIIVKLRERDREHYFFLIVKLKAQKRRVRASKLFLTCCVQPESDDLWSEDCNQVSIQRVFCHLFSSCVFMELGYLILSSRICEEQDLPLRSSTIIGYSCCLQVLYYSCIIGFRYIQ